LAVCQLNLATTRGGQILQKHQGAVKSRLKTPFGSRISLQITKGWSDLIANTKGWSNLTTKPLMDGQISPQTNKNQKIPDI
jgi:hypothetical protein